MNAYHHITSSPRRGAPFSHLSGHPHGLHHLPLEIPVVLTNGSIVVVNRTTGKTHAAPNPSDLARHAHAASGVHGNGSYGFPPTPLRAYPAYGGPTATSPAAQLGYERQTQTAPTSPTRVARRPVRRRSKAEPKFKCESCGQEYVQRASFNKHVCNGRRKLRQFANEAVKEIRVETQPHGTRAPNNADGRRSGYGQNVNELRSTARARVHDLFERIEGIQDLNVAEIEEKVSSIYDEVFDKMVGESGEFTQHTVSPALAEGGKAIPPSGTPVSSISGPGCDIATQVPDQLPESQSGNAAGCFGIGDTVWKQDVFNSLWKEVFEWSEFDALQAHDSPI